MHPRGPLVSGPRRGDPGVYHGRTRRPCCDPPAVTWRPPWPDTPCRAILCGKRVVKAAPGEEAAKGEGNLQG
ncbi:hypothetical protein E2C01_015248 [Portunus trituberculatus]|uniref:Uncharacterized protein n=1 Tax=Portunus trituberculatus TaxID=210409 RepID=A0A5B7DMB6_PORTR|nr:hypothetical protein [Portunus trituberculatus]